MNGGSSLAAAVVSAQKLSGSPYFGRSTNRTPHTADDAMVPKCASLVSPILTQLGGHVSPT